MLNRRAFTAGLGAALAVAAVAPALAQDVAGRFAGILVDVRPLEAKGLGPFAGTIRSALQTELGRAYADRLGAGRGASRLVVRIDGISLRAYSGPDGGRSFGGGTNNDYLEGEALVIAPDGRILLRHPQLSALPANSGGAWYDPNSEQRRIHALAAHYAGWLRRSSI